MKANRKTTQFVGDFLKKMEVDSKSIREPIEESENEELDNLKTNKNCRPNETCLPDRENRKSLSIRPLVIQNSQIKDSSEDEKKSIQSTANYVCNEPSMLDVLKTELEKRAQYLNQSDSDNSNSDEESDTEWI